MTRGPDPVASLVREADFVRYASTLFAPADARPHLLGLYAFDAELARVRRLVSDPMPGEIRLQWWRDAIAEPDRADVASHPVARALHGAIGFGRLPPEALAALVDARVDDLYDDPTPTVEALEARLGATRSAVIRLASLIAAGGRDPGGAAAAGLGGVAQGLFALSAALRRGSAAAAPLLPADRMAAHGVTLANLGSGGAEIAALAGELEATARLRAEEARAAYVGVAPDAAPAFLPLATLRFGSREPATWRALIRLWRAARSTPPF